jgi:hypothetical protein
MTVRAYIMSKSSVCQYTVCTGTAFSVTSSCVIRWGSIYTRTYEHTLDPHACAHLTRVHMPTQVQTHLYQNMTRHADVLLIIVFYSLTISHIMLCTIRKGCQ